MNYRKFSMELAGAVLVGLMASPSQAAQTAVPPALEVAGAETKSNEPVASIKSARLPKMPVTPRPSLMNRPAGHTAIQMNSSAGPQRIRRVAAEVQEPPAEDAAFVTDEHVIAERRNTEPANSVGQSAAPAQPSVAEIKGRVVDVDGEMQQIYLSFQSNQQPMLGSTVKLYHNFMVGPRCVGALELIRKQGHQIVARPVGNISMKKIAEGDAVVFTGIMLSKPASQQ